MLVRLIDIKEMVNKLFTIAVNIFASVPISICKPVAIFIKIKPMIPPITLAGTSIFLKKDILALNIMPTQSIILDKPNAIIKLI